MFLRGIERVRWEGMDQNTFCFAKEIFKDTNCVKNVCIRSYSGPYFPAFELNRERYTVSPLIQSECGKIRTRITLNTDTFHTVYIKAWKRTTSLQTNSMIRNLPRILIRFSINSYNFEDVKNTPITA